jgi:hypothetical protein
MRGMGRAAYAPAAWVCPAAPRPNAIGAAGVRGRTADRRCRDAREPALLALVACVLGLALFASPAGAAKAGTCGAYTVVVNGQPFTGNQARTIAPPITSVSVRGTFNEFIVRPSDFATLNYVWTGAPTPRADKNLPGGRQTIFASKVPNHGDTLTGPLSLSIAAEGVVLERAGARQDVKIQAKDCHQGGVFQMEPEPATTFTHTLGDRFSYTGQPPGAGRLCFRTSQGGWTGYDSPELATLLNFTAKVSNWSVQAGGRVGMVIGEDAVEGGCTA